MWPHTQFHIHMALDAKRGVQYPPQLLVSRSRVDTLTVPVLVLVAPHKASEEKRHVSMHRRTLLCHYANWHVVRAAEQIIGSLSYAIEPIAAGGKQD